MGKNGRVLNYSIPLEIPGDVVREAVGLSYDIFRLVNTITRELGYKPPRYITLNMNDYEVSVFDRYDKILIVLIYRGLGIPSTPVREHAVATS